MDPNPHEPAADVLIVDDDRAIREALERALTRAGLRARAVPGIEAARDAAPRARSVLLDVRLKDGDGLLFLEELREQFPRLPVVMATAYGDSERTIAAMKLGAFDYITKPLDVDLLIATLQRAIKIRPVANVTAEAVGTPLVGSSVRILEVWKAIGRAATSDAPVLITGESGTGKELVARAIHDYGSRKSAPFVAVNMAALSASLLESELFGHEKGSFTGATERRAGRFEVAANGTLFLDEIGDLEPTLQTKLLRVLQDGTFERVGSTAQLATRARVVAATSKPVEPGAMGASLRDDLYYRLAILTIALPPLRERKSDIPLLVEAFLRRLGPEKRRAVSEEAMDRLLAYQWPGNVRQLFHVLERAAIMCSSDVLDAADLAIEVEHGSTPAEHDLDLRRNGRALERRLIERALARAGGNRAEAARLLGIARPQLYTKMRELDVKG